MSFRFSKRIDETSDGYLSFSVLGICLFSTFKNGVVYFFEGMKNRTCYAIIKITALVVKARQSMLYMSEFTSLLNFCPEKKVKVPKI